MCKDGGGVQCIDYCAMLFVGENQEPATPLLVQEVARLKGVVEGFL